MHLTPLSRTLLLGIPVIFLLTFFGAPIFVMLDSSLHPNGEGMSFGVYAKVLSSNYYLSTLFGTLLLAIKVTLVTIPLGYAIAYFIVMKLKSKLTKRLAYLVVILPLFTSNIVRALGFIILLGRKGMVNKSLLDMGLIDSPIQFLYSELGVVIGLSYIFTPFMTLSIAGALQGIDKSLLQASDDLGANRLIAFYKITLPLSLPGILAGSIIVTALSVSAYVTPSVMFGGKGAVMSMLIYEQYISALDYPLGAALAIILMTITLLLIGGYSLLFERGRKG